MGEERDRESENGIPDERGGGESDFQEETGLILGMEESL
jgi:hypothetical protein